MPVLCGGGLPLPPAQVVVVAVVAAIATAEATGVALAATMEASFADENGYSNRQLDTQNM